MATEAQSTLPRDISALSHMNRMTRAEPDGTVYAGISPDTGRAMYTTPKDTGLCDSWYKAMNCAAKLDAHGHSDWRMPTKAELNELFTKRAAIGNFDETGDINVGWYWSSSQYGDYIAWPQCLRDGSRDNYFRISAASLRCVRG